MLNAVQIVKEEMILMRTDVSLAAMFNSALSAIDDLGLTVLHLPRKERLPDESPNVQIEKMYRRYYFQFLDAIIGDISTGFEQHTRDFNTYTKLEQMLVQGRLVCRCCGAAAPPKNWPNPARNNFFIVS